MALPIKLVIATTAFAFVSTQALSKPCWDLKAGMAYMYCGPGRVTPATFRDAGQVLLKKHSTKSSKKSIFLMEDRELHPTSGALDPLSDIHLE